MAEKGSGDGFLILLGVIAFVFFLPVLACGGILGISSGAVLSSPLGWICSLFFWIVTGFGYSLSKVVLKGPEEED